MSRSARGSARARRRITTVGLVLAGLALPGPIIGSATAVQGVNLDAFPRLSREDLPERHREWLDDAEVILTSAELDVFLRCETDAQRDTFIEKFWSQRDPTPGTPRNEYRETFYERVAEADYQFGRATARRGSKTDRGRIWVLLGEPMSVTRLANTQYAYPAEVWFYHADPRLGIPPFFYVAFFRDLGLGEYTLYSPAADGPMKLLNPAGVGRVRELQNYGYDGMTSGFGTELSAAYEVLRDVDGDLAHAAFSLIPGEGAVADGRISLASDIMLAQIQDIPDRIMPTARWAHTILTGAVEAEVRFETLPLRGTAVVLFDPSGIPFVHFALQTDGGKINVDNFEDDYYFTFEVAGALTDGQRRVLADLGGADGGSRVMEGSLGAAEARRLRGGSFVYMDQIPVVEGDFEFDVVLENNVSHEFGRATFDLHVPSPPEVGVRSSSPLLILDYDRQPAYDPLRDRLPFQVGALGLLPAVDATFPSGGMLHVYHQIWISAAARSAGTSLQATYRLENEAGFLAGQVMHVSPERADRHGTLDQVASLSLATVPAGSYRLFVDIDGDDRPPEYLEVRVIDPSELPEPPFVQTRQQPPAADPRIAYQRALQYRATGRTDAAMRVFEAVLDRAPEFEEALELQVELLMEAGRYDDVDRLLAPRLIEKPNDIGLLVKLAEAAASSGRHYDAIRYYERARLGEAEDRPDTLNPLAASYYADGQVEKARELLEQSLEIEPDQPEVRRLLQEVLGRRDQQW